MEARQGTTDGHDAAMMVIPATEPQQLRQLRMRRAWRHGPGQSDRSVRPVELASVSDVDGFRLAISTCGFEPLNKLHAMLLPPPLSGSNPPPAGVPAQGP
jgi:hypothetical protein